MIFDKSNFVNRVSHYLKIEKRQRRQFSMGWDALGIIVQLAVPVLDKLVEAIPSVVVFMLSQVVVEGLVNGFDVGLYRMANDI